MKTKNINRLVGIIIFSLVFSACSDDDNNDTIETVIQPVDPPAGFTLESKQLNGVEINYAIGGEGEALLLIHGWPQNWYEWHRVMPALADNYTVIVPDMRGIGDSGKPLGTENYRKVTMAKDMHELVQSLGFSKVKIAAHDIGAMVAYAYAVQYPNEVEKLALFEAPLPGIEPYWEALLTRKDLLLWHFGLNQTQGSEELIVGNERAYLTRMYSDFSANPGAFSEEEIDEYVRAYSGVESLRGGFEWYRAFNLDTLDNQQFAQTKLSIPTLAIGGEFSLGGLMVPLLQAVVDSSMVSGGTTNGVFANTGHWVMEERPNEVVQEIQTFFEK